MKELERRALLADQATVRGLLAEIPESDPLGRLSFSARLAEIDRRLSELDATKSTIGSVALMFSGGPVRGSRAIDADFAGNALRSFKDLIAKQVASDEFGKLGSRGPLRSEVRLGVTDFVRGSVGFVLEESAENEEIADTAVKLAIDEVTSMVISTGSESEADFERAVELLDNRTLISLREFFKTLDDTGATVRIVEDNHDAVLDAKSVSRGRRRVDRIEINDEESEQVVGELLGILPGSKRFEMKLIVTGEVIKGAVAASVAPAYLTSIEMPGETPVVGRLWRAKMKIREITEHNKPTRKLYTLLGLLERVDPLQPK